MADPVVHITNGVPDSGTGNITTLGMTLVDGANATLGANADAAATAGGTGSLSSKLRAISRDLVANIVLAAGNNLIGMFKLSDGTNSVTIKPASTAAQASDTALVVALSPNSVNPDGRALPASSAPVVLAQQFMQACAAGGTTTLGTIGAVGDYLDFVLVCPANTSPNSVQIQDGTSTAVTIFPGGASSVPSTIPFAVPIKACSKSGGWKIILGSSVTAVAVGNGS